MLLRLLNRSLQRPVFFSFSRPSSSHTSIFSNRRADEIPISLAKDQIPIKVGIESEFSRLDISGSRSKSFLHEITAINSIQLPALENPSRVYSLPTLDKVVIEAPPPSLQQILEKMDPLANKTEIKTPSFVPPIAMHLGPRLLTIRRKKMKKHKRKKRYDRDFFKYQKYHREKKLRAEREFVKRMKSHLSELNAFDPEKYVEGVIAEAKKEWQDELAPSGKPLYPHWSRLMSLEELYGLPKNDHIDKKAGLPNEEDLEKIKQLKKEYDTKYRGL